MFEHKRVGESSMENKAKATMITTTTTTMLFSKIITSIYKFLLNLTLHSHKSLQILHHLLSLSFSWILFFFHLLPSLYPNPPKSLARKHKKQTEIQLKGVGGKSGIARALSQILSIINELPITSRKYELVRSLAETLIEDNHKQDFELLRDVNRKALSSAFEKTITQLEAAMIEEEEEMMMKNQNQNQTAYGPINYWLSRFFKTVRSFGGSRNLISRPAGSTAEKFAIELLWLAQMLTACGSAEVAVSKWGSASNLAWLSLSAEPRLQGSILKISAFLFKQAKEMGGEAKVEGKGEEIEGDELKKMMNILITWLPILCQASNGTDAPVLNNSGRVELERVLEDIIEMLKHEDEQEKVLALWLHHFTSCPLSDWPNLQSSYAQWCDASRKLLIIRQQA